jgi:glutaredoxin 3
MQRRLCAVSSVLSRIQSQIQSSPVLVYSKSYCPYCTQVKELFEDMDVPFTAVELDLLGSK